MKPLISYDDFQRAFEKKNYSNIVKKWLSCVIPINMKQIGLKAVNSISQQQTL